MVSPQLAWFRPNPAPGRGVEDVADEPADDEVVGDQQFLSVLLAGGAEVRDGRLQAGGVVVALGGGYAVELWQQTRWVLAALRLGRYGGAVSHEVAGVPGDVWQVTGDHVGGLRGAR